MKNVSLVGSNNALPIPTDAQIKVVNNPNITILSRSLIRTPLVPWHHLFFYYFDKHPPTIRPQPRKATKITTARAPDRPFPEVAKYRPCSRNHPLDPASDAPSQDHYSSDLHPKLRN